MTRRPMVSGQRKWQRENDQVEKMEYAGTAGLDSGLDSRQDNGLDFGPVHIIRAHLPVVYCFTMSHSSTI